MMMKLIKILVRGFDIKILLVVVFAIGLASCGSNYLEKSLLHTAIQAGVEALIK
jgi:hypothetical protein